MTHLALLCIALLFALCLFACYGWHRSDKARGRCVGDYWIVRRDRDEHAREERRLRAELRDMREAYFEMFEERNNFARENEALRRGKGTVSKWN